MKIKDLNLINVIYEEYIILYNHNLYDKYLNNEDINYLINNKDNINNLFLNNVGKLKFDIILNSKNLDNLKNKLILELRYTDIEEFANYVNYIPFKFLNKKNKEKIKKQFDKFKKLDDYEALNYFNSICRK